MLTRLYFYNLVNYIKKIMKNEYLKFIKQFSKININKICKNLNINRSNVLNGIASEGTTKLLYDEIKKELNELLKKEVDSND